MFHIKNKTTDDRYCYVFSTEKHKVLQFFSHTEILAALTITLLVTYLSIWQGRYHNDPHHWGLMLSNAMDLYHGKRPYEEIFIQYGILTTAIHALAFSASNTLLSLIAITGLAYGLGIFLVFLISKCFFKSNYFLPILICSTIFLLHPYAIYPWSNYIAFPFLMLGIYFLIKNSRTDSYRGCKLNYFLSGLFFSLGVLSRETLFPAIFLLILSFSLFSFLYCKIPIKVFLKKTLILYFGFLIPLSIFFIYLVSSDLFFQWYKLSITLPIFYSENSSHFQNINFLFGLDSFFYSIFSYVFTDADSRWFLFLVIYVAQAIFLFDIIVTRKLEKKFSKDFLLKLVLLSFASILLISSSLHLVEIFRLVSGSIVGIVILAFLLNSWSNIIAFIFFILLIFNFIPTIFTEYPSIYTHTDSFERKNTSQIRSGLFKGQRWTSDNLTFYNDLEKDFGDILNMKCGIKYHRNYTSSSFITALSPFSPYQQAPFDSIQINKLWPNYDIDKKIQEAKDIILIQGLPNKDLKSYKPPKNFRVFSKRNIPPGRYVVKESGTSTLIVNVPSICL